MSVAANRQGKMQNLINYRMKVTLQDGRQMVGQMLAFDKHMNLVLADTEEFRRTRRKGKAAPGAAQTITETEERRAIGLTIIRGAHVISLSVDGPPPADPVARLGTASTAPSTVATLTTGPGVARPAGRGIPVGLTGPAPGVGGVGGFGPPGGFPPSFGGQPFPGRGGPPGPFPPGAPPAGFGGGPPPPFGGPPGFGPPGGRGAPPPGFSR